MPTLTHVTFASSARHRPAKKTSPEHSYCVRCDDCEFEMYVDSASKALTERTIHAVDRWLHWVRLWAYSPPQRRRSLSGWAEVLELQGIKLVQ